MPLTLNLPGLPLKPNKNESWAQYCFHETSAFPWNLSSSWPSVNPTRELYDPKITKPQTLRYPTETEMWPKTLWHNMGWILKTFTTCLQFDCIVCHQCNNGSFLKRERNEERSHFKWITYLNNVQKNSVYFYSHPQVKWWPSFEQLKEIINLFNFSSSLHHFLCVQGFIVE